MRIYNGFLIIALVGLSGCGRIIDWGKELAPQGDPFKQNLASAREYIRSATAYDQLSTVATFDALWLSDEVRSAYVRLFVDRRGKGEEQYATIVRRQLEENNFVIAFYVLCPFEVSLGDAEADWMVFLRVNNAQYAPTEVKIIDLAPEYRAIFDKRVNRFKQAYIVKFDTRDASDAALIGASTKTLSLVFRSMRKDLTLIWDFAKMAAHKDVAQAHPVPVQLAEPTVTQKPESREIPTLVVVPTVVVPTAVVPTAVVPAKEAVSASEPVSTVKG